MLPLLADGLVFLDIPTEQAHAHDPQDLVLFASRYGFR